MIMDKNPAGMFRNVHKKSHKTLEDLFKLLVAKLRDTLEKNVSASGIAEELTEENELP